MYIDMIITSINLGSSFHEYLYYTFYKKNHKERKTFASMGYMYEYQLMNNPKKSRYYLEDKLIFLMEYKDFVGRKWIEIKKSSILEIVEFIKNKSKVVLKNSKGGAGKNVRIIEISQYNSKSLLNYAIKNNFNLMEEFVIQHNDLNVLSPNSLNTIRLITQINNKNEVDIIGSILRVGIELSTDNLSTGGIACPIDSQIGIINGPGISFDITKPEYYKHPLSNKTFIGFIIPYWKEVVEMCKNAALLHPENKSIGWDIAIQADGPIIIEGNHDWGARLWQMPTKQGMKQILDKYIAGS